VALPKANYTANVTQHLGLAKLSHILQSLDNITSVVGETIVGENGTNAVLTTLTCTQAQGKDCIVTLTLRDCCNNNGGFQEQLGGSANGITFRKENLHEATNPAHLGDCDPDSLYYNIERSFAVDAASHALTLQNGSCLWVLDPHNATGSAITTGSCDDAQGEFTFVQQNGTIVWAGGAGLGGQSRLCLDESVTLKPCAVAANWTLSTDASRPGYLHPVGSSSSCIHVVPDNSNNTVAAATIVVDLDTGKALPAVAGPTQVNASNVADGISYAVSLKSGIKYVVVTAVLTLRDIGCAGIRPQAEQCPQPIEVAAAAHAGALAGAGRLAAAHSEHDAFWAAYWNASAIDITGGNAVNPNATVLEQW
jgi:hypothetical protein